MAVKRVSMQVDEDLYEDVKVWRDAFTKQMGVKLNMRQAVQALIRKGIEATKPEPVGGE